MPYLRPTSAFAQASRLVNPDVCSSMNRLGFMSIFLDATDTTLFLVKLSRLSSIGHSLQHKTSQQQGDHNQNQPHNRAENQTWHISEWVISVTPYYGSFCD